MSDITIDEQIAYQQEIVDDLIAAGNPRLYAQDLVMEQSLLASLTLLRDAQGAMPEEPDFISEFAAHAAGHKSYDIGITPKEINKLITYIDALKSAFTGQYERAEKAEYAAQPQNPCSCVPDGDDGTVAHLCEWHKTEFGKAYRMQNVADTLTVENIAKLPMDRLRLWIAHGIQESSARKKAEAEREQFRKDADIKRRIAGVHASDCATHNAPAMENGACDCGAIEKIKIPCGCYSSENGCECGKYDEAASDGYAHGWNDAIDAAKEKA